jgi:HEAT repeat protein
MTSCFRGPVRIIQYCIVFFILFLMPWHSFADPLFERVQEDYQNEDWEMRLAAIEKLKGMKDEKTVDFLIKVAGDKREAWEVNIKAIEFLGEIKNTKAVPVLLSILNSRSLKYRCPAIRSYTATALGNFKGDNDILKALIKGIQYNEPLVRIASIQALGNIGNKDAVPYLLPLLKNESISIRLASVSAIERIGDSQTIPYIQAVAEKDSDPDVRNAAKFTLGNLAR